MAVLFPRTLCIGQLNDFVVNRERDIRLDYNVGTVVILPDGEHAVLVTSDNAAIIAINMQSTERVAMLALQGAFSHLLRSQSAGADCFFVYNDRVLLGSELVKWTEIRHEAN